jgi:hypothetical protein
MCNSCDESVVGRLGEGDVDERGSEEVEDNLKFIKRRHMPLAVFPQARGEVELVDVRENQFWIELPNGRPVTAS